MSNRKAAGGGQDLPSIRACLDCHSEPHASGIILDTPVNAATVRSACLDCHMPNKASTGIVLQERDGSKMNIFLRTHLIESYPEISAAILEKER
ncbi:MAG: hypothetical protein ACFE0O_08150 [Opitutales bacterium]